MTDKTIAELREWKKQYDIFPSMAADKEFLEILSRAVPVKEVEPLEELAKRKGHSVEIAAWVHRPDGSVVVCAAAPLSAVRGFLEGLEDVKGGR